MLSGTVMVYGDRAHSRRERFEPGSLELAPVTHLDYEHDRSRILAYSPDGGLELKDDSDAMRMTATLPPLPFADHVLQEVRAGERTGLSVEFRCIRSRVENGVRIIEKGAAAGRGAAQVTGLWGFPRGSARTSAKGLALMAALPTEITAIIPNVAAENAGGILGRDAPDSTRATTLATVALRLCFDHAPTAPIEIMQEAAVRLAGWLWGRAPHLTAQRRQGPLVAPRSN